MSKISLSERVWQRFREHQTYREAGCKVLALTKYSSLGGSSRTRFYQFIPALRNQHPTIRVDVMPLLGDKYVKFIADSIDGRDFKRPYVYIALCYLKRLWDLHKVFFYDVIWIEKEIFPGLPAVFERSMAALGKRLVVDFDDATYIWYQHHQNWFIRTFMSRKIDRVIGAADAITVGNRRLASYAREITNCPVEVIAPRVDHLKYVGSGKAPSGGDSFTIGWIGSPSTSSDLALFADALKALTQESGTEFITIGAYRFTLDGIRHQAIPWQEETEAAHLVGWDAAIAPLSEGPWQQGKCCYKAIQCMAAGLPVISTPAGAINDIIRHGENGFLASNAEECEQVLRMLRADPLLRQRIGKEARRTVIKNYSVQGGANAIAEILRCNNISSKWVPLNENYPPT